MTLSFQVAPAQDGFTLRDFLRQNGVSAQLIKTVKYEGGFFVDGAPAHTNVCVRAGQTAAFALPAEHETSVLPEALPLQIVLETPHVMVLEKPAGQTVHPTRGYSCGTLANAFCGLMAARGQSAPFRAVNRIDRNTSGLVLCAMNAYAAPLLAQSVQKEYFAIAEGEMPLGKATIDAPLGLAPGSIIKRAVCPDGKPSRTEYEVLAAGGGLSLVRCVPITGRTHQIRAHFSFLGHPLAGDDLYGGGTALIGRHALHCGTLTFAMPGVKQQRCESPLPPDMAALAARCKAEFSQ